MIYDLTGIGKLRGLETRQNIDCLIYIEHSAIEVTLKL